VAERARTGAGGGGPGGGSPGGGGPGAGPINREVGPELSPESIPSSPLVPRGDGIAIGVSSVRVVPRAPPDPRVVFGVKRSAAAGAFRRLRQQLIDRGDPRTIVCTSANPGEGKTTLAANLALAYAEIGKPGQALPQLRFYVQNADTSAGGDEARKILETRFVIAQLLAAEGYPDEALTELRAVRPLLAEAFGPGSTQVRNLDKQAARLMAPP
jgi:hypothetical protein